MVLFSINNPTFFSDFENANIINVMCNYVLEYLLQHRFHEGLSSLWTLTLDIPATSYIYIAFYIYLLWCLCFNMARLLQNLFSALKRWRAWHKETMDCALLLHPASRSVKQGGFLLESFIMLRYSNNGGQQRDFRNESNFLPKRCVDKCLSHY